MMAALAELDDAQLVERFNGLALTKLSMNGGLDDGKGIELFFEDAGTSFHSNGLGTPTSIALADATANPGDLLLDVVSPRADSEGGLSSCPDTEQLEDTGGPNEGSTADAGAATQICFDFTKGMCTRGDKCKFSHDIATIVHFNSKEKGICFDYLRNQCHRGLLCRFSHDLSNIAQQCQVYNGAASAAPRANRTASICYDFVKGVCTRGNECRYSHDLSLIARTARSSSSGSGPATEVCYDFLRGRCSRAANCKYSHSVALLGSGILTTLQPGSLGAMGSSMGISTGSMVQGHPSLHAMSAPVTPRVGSVGGSVPHMHMGAHMGHVGSVGAHGLMMSGYPAGAVAGSAPSNGFAMAGGSGMADALTAAATDRLAMFAAMQQQQQQQQMAAAASTAGMGYTHAGAGGFGAARGMQPPPPPPPQSIAVGHQQAGAGSAGNDPAGMMPYGQLANQPYEQQGGGDRMQAPLQPQQFGMQQCVGTSQLTSMLAADASRRVSDDRGTYRDQPQDLIAAANGGIHAMHARFNPSPLPPPGPRGTSLPPTPSGRQLYIRTTPTPTPGACAPELPSPHGTAAYAHGTPGSYSHQAFSPQGYSPASYAGPQAFSPQGYSPGPLSAPAQASYMHQRQQQWNFYQAQQQQQQQQQNGLLLARTSSAPQPDSSAPAQNAQGSISYPHKQQQQQQQQQQQPMYSAQHNQHSTFQAPQQQELPAADLPPPSPLSFKSSMPQAPPRLLVVPEACDVPQSTPTGSDKTSTAPQPIPGGGTGRVHGCAGPAVATGVRSPRNVANHHGTGEGFLGLGDSVDSNNGNGCLSPNLLPLLKEIWNR